MGQIPFSFLNIHNDLERTLISRGSVHVVITDMESALEGPLTIFQHDQIKFLLNHCLRVIVLQQDC